MRRMEDRPTIHICELTYNLCNFVWKINMEYNLINFDVLSVNEFKKTKLKSIFINAKILRYFILEITIYKVSFGA